MHLTCRTSFLLLGVFLTSLVHHHHHHLQALLHRQVLILDRLLTFLMAFFTLVLKPSFPRNLSLHSHISLFQAHLLEFDHSVFGSHWRRYVKEYPTTYNNSVV